MSAPLVSVIMPVHNAAPYVEAAIRSVLEQTVGRLELIVVDDASTDDSSKIISRFSDPRIRRLRSDTPLNAAGARNLGIARAQAEMVAFLDADDIALPHRLESQLRALQEQPEVGVLGSLAEAIDENSTALGDSFILPRPADEIPATLLFQNCLALSTVMLRRTWVRPFDPALAPAEDYDLWVQLAAETSIAILPKKLVQYRTHAGNVSSRQPEKMAAAVTSIWSRQLTRLGLQLAPSHPLLSQWPIPPTLSQLHEAEQWLLALRTANEQKRVHAEPAFQRVLAARWFSLCLDSWLLGFSVWPIYHRSPLAAPTIKRRALLLRRLLPRLLRR